MSRYKLLLAFILCGALSAVVMAAPIKGKSPQTLGAGEYTAKVKAIVCSGCGPFIEKTMNGFSGIESAKSNSAKLSVQFKVKPGATVKVAELQKSLKASAELMGMGADYSLSDIKPLKK